ncbi:hypothetical protein HMPREF9944_01062 [Segatella maculosa OT 289]|uniref:Uncharacterized protein n=1 Tax=Segatella maculosa OT 289 TaxID=999422 RepID=H1HLL8_9BACT|nr:hypothetical protein HMPREF9944_01062 [Segatella maculosa OT 289]
MDDEGFFNDHLLSSMEDDKKTRNNSCLPWKKIKKGTVVRCCSAIGWILLPQAGVYTDNDVYAHR